MEQVEQLSEDRDRHRQYHLKHALAYLGHLTDLKSIEAKWVNPAKHRSDVQSVQ